MTPIISYVTVVLNGEKTLHATIESVISQLPNNCEYLIIDGGSLDNTVNIIKQYEKHLAYWISEPDSGIYQAWNKALLLCRGSYIGFLGCDDILLPGSIEAYLSGISLKPEVDYWSSRVVLGSLDGRVIGEAWRWSRFRRHMTVAHVGSLHKRALFDKFGLFNEAYRIAGDYEFILRAGPLLQAGFINQVTAIMGDNGLSNSLITRALQETKNAKIQRQSTSSFLAHIDHITAHFKRFIRMRFDYK
jgi:glycosyltransferase involved in cell wall biosynthesis